MIILGCVTSQLSTKKRLASKLPGLFAPRGGTGYPAVGLGKTKKKVNDFKT